MPDNEPGSFLGNPHAVKAECETAKLGAEAYYKIVCTLKSAADSEPDNLDLQEAYKIFKDPDLLHVTNVYNYNPLRLDQDKTLADKPPLKIKSWPDIEMDGKTYQAPGVELNLIRFKKPYRQSYWVDPKTHLSKELKQEIISTAIEVTRKITQMQKNKTPIATREIRFKAAQAGWPGKKLSREQV